MESTETASYFTALPKKSDEGSEGAPRPAGSGNKPCLRALLIPERCSGCPVQPERRCRVPAAAREAHRQVFGSSNSLAQLNNVISC